MPVWRPYALQLSFGVMWQHAASRDTGVHMQNSELSEELQASSVDEEPALSRRALWRWPSVIVASGALLCIWQLAAVYYALRPGEFTPDAAGTLATVLNLAPLFTMLAVMVILGVIILVAGVVLFRTGRWPIRSLAISAAALAFCMESLAGTAGAGAILHSVAGDVTRVGDSRACYVVPVGSHATHTEHSGLLSDFAGRSVTLDSLLLLQPGPREVVCPYASDDVRVPVRMRTAAR